MFDLLKFIKKYGFVSYISPQGSTVQDDMISEFENLSSTDEKLTALFSYCVGNFAKLDELKSNEIYTQEIIYNQLKPRIDDIGNKFSNLETKIDDIGNSLDERLSNLKVDVDNTNVVSTANAFNNFNSLNGLHGSFHDGSFVTSTIYATKLEVISSFLLLNSTDNYIIAYRLKNLLGDEIILPANFVYAYTEIENSESEKESQGE